MMSTMPAKSAESWESYCEAIGVPVDDARAATVVRAMYLRLRHADELLAADTEQAAGEINQPEAKE